MDVWSQEGVGTEIKVTFNAEIDDDEFGEKGCEVNSMEPLKAGSGALPTISLVGFDTPHRGIRLLDRTLRSYLEKWWGFDVVTGTENGDIVILNEDISPVIYATECHDISRPFIIISSARGSPSVMQVATEHESIGGFCRILYKPGGPTRLCAILKLAIHATKIGSTTVDLNTPPDDVSGFTMDGGRTSRRSSEGCRYGRRPSMVPRSSSAFPAIPSLPTSDELPEKEACSTPPASSLVSPLQNGATNNTTQGFSESVEVSTPPEFQLRMDSSDPLENPEKRKPTLGIATETPRGRERSCNTEGSTPEAAAPEIAITETTVPGVMSPTTTVLESNVPDIVGSPVSVPENTSPVLESPKSPMNGVESNTGPSIGSIIPHSPTSAVVPVGESGTLLKSSIQAEPNPGDKKFRVLVVEDNGILRNLL